MSTPSPAPRTSAEAGAPRLRGRDRGALRAAARAALPEASRPPGWGRRVGGALVGLVLTPVAFLLTGVGSARLAEATGATAQADALGTALLVLGVLVLAALALLGAWSPAAPVAGGLVWGLGVGTAAVVRPGRFEELAERLGVAGAPAATEQFARSASGGLLLVVGALLLAAGIAAALARRTGRRAAVEAAAAEAAAAAAAQGAPGSGTGRTGT